MRPARILAAAALGGSALFAVPASALGAATCPAGTQGVIIEHNGSTTMLCTSAVRDAQRIVATLIDFDIVCDVCAYIELPPK